MFQSLYRGLTLVAGPLVWAWLLRRRAVGKEDPDRIRERRGVPTLARPEGRLVWFHAASVGEANSILVLVNRMLEADSALHVLLTTGTVNSARLMAKRLPERAFHQYVPVDLPGAVRRFLDHWRPDLALWTESEIWPNMLSEIARRGIPAAVVNARMSERSFRRWSLLPGVVGGLLGAFSVALAQTEADAERLRRLGAGNVQVVGNLKFSSDPPPADERALEDLRRAVASRPVWMLASCHPGEDEIAVRVHETLADKFPGLLTIIVPRHAERGAGILEVARGRGLTAALRSAGCLPNPDQSVYIGDTMGEMGVYYQAVGIVCMGGSLIRHGGQNPIEPAMFGCAVLYGPNMWNFTEITAQLEEADGALRVENGDALTKAVCKLLADPERRERLGEAARRVTERNRLAVDRALGALAPLIRAAGIQTNVGV